MDTSKTVDDGAARPALTLLSSERPRNVSWWAAGALLFGDWGTSRLYVLGLAFLVAGRTSVWLIMAMSLLILSVGWAYTQICRIFANGGGVYTAGRQRAAVIGVVGALLLFADYTVTASLSAYEAFHYFGLGKRAVAEQVVQDPGDDIRRLTSSSGSSEAGPDEPIGFWRSPGSWAIVSIGLIGLFNLMGPKHTAGFALLAAAGMVLITVLIVGFALPQVRWSELQWGRLLDQPVGELWYGFVFVVLALSGVEAIANLTGVMKKPVPRTAGRAIWVVAIEVALFNVLLAIIMLSLAPEMSREAHKEDMLAYMARVYVGTWGEWTVRIVAGLLLLSATNTAVNGLMSIIYVMSRDGEMPRLFQKLNGFGAPWVAAIVATAVPSVVLLMASGLEMLASMYAIGIVGAVALNCTLVSLHPRLRRWYRKSAMGLLALLLVGIWLTLAVTKIHALVFVSLVLGGGLLLRFATQAAARRRGKPSLFRQAVMEQLTPQAMAMPKVMLTTAGGDELADAALQVAKAEHAALVVCFVRDVALDYRVDAENRLTLDTDPAAQAMFTEFLAHGARWGVPIIPAYDSGRNPHELIAEMAAMNGVTKVLIGSSRRGMVHHLIRGSFQRKLESVLPPEIPVRVISPPVRTDVPSTPGEEG